MIDDDILDNEDHDHEARLQLQLGPPPVSPLGVVPDGVVVLHPEMKIELKIINKKQTSDFLSNSIARPAHILADKIKKVAKSCRVEKNAIFLYV